MSEGIDIRRPCTLVRPAEARFQRWLSARSPIADMSRLAFVGDDEVHAVIVDVLSHVPEHVAWHGVEHVFWIEIGRSAVGRQGPAPRLREPAGDIAHIIVLDGNVVDEKLRFVIAHELAHSMADEIRFLPRAHTIGRERIDRDDAAGEQRADDLARRWGFPKPSREQHRQE